MGLVGTTEFLLLVETVGDGSGLLGDTEDETGDGKIPFRFECGDPIDLKK